MTRVPSTTELLRDEFDSLEAAVERGDMTIDQAGPAMKEIGDALRARFDFLEQRVEGGDLEYLAVMGEMEQISDFLVQHKV